jgi:hypothetical protein
MREMAISIIKRAMNKGNSNNVMFMFFLTVIGLSLLSLSVPTVMTNAQAPSGSTSASNSTINEAHITQMGICVVGAGGPCNGKQ